MKNLSLYATVLAASASIASAQTSIDSIDLSGTTLTGINVGGDSYTSLVPPTSLVDNKASTDYIHIGPSAPASLADAVGSFDIETGSLNHPFEVQFGQTLFGTTLVYLIINENDNTPLDSAVVYPLDSAGNRIGGVSGLLRFPSLGTMPVLAVDDYNRTTAGTANGVLNRTLLGAVFTLDDLGIGGLIGTEGLEFESTNLDPQEIGLARAEALIDPTLLQDTSAADADFNFGTTFKSSGEAAETEVRTVRYVNSGPTQDLVVGSVTATAGFVVTDVGLNGTGGQTLPLTLGVGDYLEVSVKGQPGVTGPLPTTGTVIIDTDEDSQDQTLPATAIVVAQGDLMNRNPLFSNGGGTATDWLGGHARVSPGLTSGSTRSVRVFGLGDPAAGTVGRAAQTTTLPDGAPDFESVFIFTPVSDFATYTGAAASGDFTDRTMQYLLYSSDATVGTGTLITAADTDNILINLAYFPDGAQNGGTPGFYVFNGISSSWQLALAVDLAGSTDADGNGLLDPAAGDTVEAYRVALRGIGFGSPGASYDITVSTIDAGGLSSTLNSGPLSVWHGVSGDTGTLAAHSFTSADASESNVQAGYTTPFWVDSSQVYFDQQPDAVMSAVGTPALILADGDVSPLASANLVIRNDGDDANLSVGSFNFVDSSFSVTQALPVSIAPGASATFNVQWDSAQSAPDSAAKTSYTISSSSPGVSPVFSLEAGLTSSAAYNPNFDFEVLGNDPDTDTDTFLFWNEGTNVQDVPGLLAGSATAAHVNGNTMIGTRYVANPTFWNAAPVWVAEAVFAIGGTNGRIFNFKVREELGGENYTEVNLRYEAGKWQAFDGIPSAGGSWVDLIDMTASPLQVSEDNDDNGSLDDAGDVKIPYQIRVSGSGWEPSGTPRFNLEILDASGTTLGAATGRTELLSGFVVEDVPTFGPNYLEIRNTGSEYWVDDVVIAAATATEGIEIISVSGGPGGFTIVYDAGGADVNIQRSSPGLTGFEDIATGENSGIFTDTSAPAGKAFYRIYPSE